INRSYGGSACKCHNMLGLQAGGRLPGARPKPLGRELAPSPQQGEVKSAAYRAGAVERCGQPGIEFELGTVDLDLGVEKGVEIRAFVGGGFVVHNPAHAVGDEAAVNLGVAQAAVHPPGEL